MMLLPLKWLLRMIMLMIAAAWLMPAVEAKDQFPVTISHALGTTIVNQPPERIVTLGWSSEDAVLALGKIPVGMPRYRFFASGIFPWNEDRLAGARPYLFEGDIDYEAIAALRPDLILGIYSGIDDLAYKRLSSIAPTVGLPDCAMVGRLEGTDGPDRAGAWQDQRSQGDDREDSDVPYRDGR